MHPVSHPTPAQSPPTVPQPTLSGPSCPIWLSGPTIIWPILTISHWTPHSPRYPQHLPSLLVSPEFHKLPLCLQSLWLPSWSTLPPFPRRANLEPSQGHIPALLLPRGPHTWQHSTVLKCTAPSSAVTATSSPTLPGPWLTFWKMTRQPLPHGLGWGLTKILLVNTVLWLAHVRSLQEILFLTLLEFLKQFWLSASTFKPSKKAAIILISVS